MKQTQIIMDKPFKYSIICNITKNIILTDREPVTRDLQTWESTKNSDVSERVVTKTSYVDTRYAAKLRLYNYVTFTRNGIEVPRYNPYLNTRVGVDIPILS